MNRDALNGAGLALSLVGAVMAGVGISQTWRQFRPEGARFWAPFYGWADRQVWQPALSVRRAAQRQWNRLRGASDVRPVSGVMAGMVVAAAFDARAVVTYGPLPDPRDSDAFATELEERTNYLRTELQDVQEQLRSETAVREKVVHGLQRQVDDQSERMRDMTQQVAISGLPLEMTGLFFVVAGMVLQGIAQVSS